MAVELVGGWLPMVSATCTGHGGTMRWPSYAIALIALTASHESIAADWLEIGRATNGTTVLLDLESLQQSAEGVKLWVKLDYSTKVVTEADRKRAQVAEDLAKRGMLACNGRRSPLCQPGDDTATESRALWRIDCAERSLTILSSTTFGSDGRVLRSQTAREAEANLGHIVPDTIADAVSAKVCPSS